MPKSGSTGVRSGLQPGGVAPSNERVTGGVGKIGTPGAHAEPSDTPRRDAPAEKPRKGKKPDRGK